MQFAHHKILIIILLITYTLNTFAQSSDTLQLNEVKIQASRASTQALHAPRTVELITAAQIAQLPVKSVSEVLEYALGADLRSRGPVGMQSDLSIRGGSFEQTLVLLNGIPLTDPQTGHHSLNLPVSLDEILHIEVIQGGAARIFGPKALSGAINIVTRSSANTSATLAVEGGEYGSYGTSAQGNIAFPKSGLSAGISRYSTDGYISNTDGSRLQGNLFYHTAIGKLNVSAFTGAEQKAFGAQNFYSTSFPTQFEETKLYFGGLKLDYRIKSWQFNLTGSYRQHHDRFELYREGADWYVRNNGFFIMGDDTAASFYKGHNYHRTEVNETNLQIVHSLKKHTFSAGVSYRNEHIYSNVLGEPMDKPKHVTGYPDYAQFLREADRNEYHVYLEDQFQSGRWWINGGMLMTVSDDYGTRVFPGIDVAYLFNRYLRTYANFNQAIRYPTYTDLYYRLGGAVGSIGLKPEKSDNYELGFRFQQERTNAQLAVFHRASSSLIDWIRKNGSSITEAANITAVNFTGVDFSIRLQPEAYLTLLDEIQFSYTFISADEKSTDFESNYALDFLKHKCTAIVQKKINAALQFSFAISYQEREGGYLKPGASKETEYGWFYTADSRITYSKGIGKLYLDVKNIFNHIYTDIGNIPQPGRWITMGIKLNIKK